jgi:hypothetical protein
MCQNYSSQLVNCPVNCSCIHFDVSSVLVLQHSDVRVEVRNEL